MKDELEQIIDTHTNSCKSLTDLILQVTKEYYGRTELSGPIVARLVSGALSESYHLGRVSALMECIRLQKESSNA